MNIPNIGELRKKAKRLGVPDELTFDVAIAYANLAAKNRMALYVKLFTNRALKDTRQQTKDALQNLHKKELSHA